MMISEKMRSNLYEYTLKCTEVNMRIIFKTINIILTIELSDTFNFEEKKTGDTS